MIKSKRTTVIFILLVIGTLLPGCNNEVMKNNDYEQIMYDMQDQIINLLNEDGTDLAREFDSSLFDEMDKSFKTIDKDILNEKNRKTFDLLKSKRKLIIEMMNFEDRVEELLNDQKEVDEGSILIIEEQLDHFEDQTMYYQRLSKKIKKYRSKFD